MSFGINYSKIEMSYREHLHLKPKQIFINLPLEYVNMLYANMLF